MKAGPCQPGRASTHFDQPVVPPGGEIQFRDHVARVARNICHRAIRPDQNLLRSGALALNGAGQSIQEIGVVRCRSYSLKNRKPEERLRVTRLQGPVGGGDRGTEIASRRLEPRVRGALAGAVDSNGKPVTVRAIRPE